MASYHLSDDGPRACSTTPENCPYAKAGGDHYDNVAEAQLNYEKIMEEKHGLVGLARAAHNRQSETYRLYENMERVQRDGDTHREIVATVNYSRSAPSKNPRAPFVASGRTKGYDRMRRNHPGRRVSKMATRGGRELFTSVGQTPPNILRLQSYMTKELQKVVS